MSNTRNNHYVPQFIMKKWRNNKGNLHIYEIKNGKVNFKTQHNVKKVNQKRKLYSQELESKLSKVEDETAILIKKLEKNEFKVPFSDLKTYKTYLMKKIMILNIQWGHRNHFNPYTVNYLNRLNLIDYKICYYTYRKKKLVCPNFYFQFKNYHINDKKYNILLQPLSPDSLICCLPKNINPILEKRIKQDPIFINNIIASNIEYNDIVYEKYIGCSKGYLLTLSDFVDKRSEMNEHKTLIKYNQKNNLL